MRESAIRRAGDTRAEDLVSLAPGFPDPALFPWEELRDIAHASLSGADPGILQYGPTRGYRPLLGAIAELLASRGIEANPDDILVTTGSQQGLDLCAQVFVDPGDTILVELPTYTGAITAFAKAGARLVGVRQDEEGIDIGDLDAVFQREQREGRRIPLVYVVPNFQNPTGRLMTSGRRASLLDWAARRRVLIVEDDPYGALYFDDVACAEETRPIKADDRTGVVIYLSSFSKTVAPGLRVAWITAPSAIVSKFEIAKQSADLCTGGLDQRMIYEMCKRGSVAGRLPALRAAYQHKRTVMERALRRTLGDRVTWPEPKGGFFLWACFREPVDTEALLPYAIKRNVVFVPGSAFFVEGRGAQYARLSFSWPPSERIEIGINRLADAVRDLEEAMASTSAALPAAASSAAQSGSAAGRSGR
jgi:2-aminoadipate transaminase